MIMALVICIHKSWSAREWLWCRLTTTYCNLPLFPAFGSSVGVKGSCQMWKQRRVCEVVGCWWRCIIRRGELLNMACIPVPSPLLLEINDPDIHFSLWTSLNYSVPQIIKSFNAAKGDQSSFFRQCNVDQLNETWPLNHRAVGLGHPHLGVYTEWSSNTGKAICSVQAHI